jgi:hypothetical protein
MRKALAGTPSDSSVCIMWRRIGCLSVYKPVYRDLARGGGAPPLFFFRPWFVALLIPFSRPNFLLRLVYAISLRKGL